MPHLELALKDRSKGLPLAQTALQQMKEGDALDFWFQGETECGVK